MKKIIVLFVVLVVIGCLPGSRNYRPLPWEENLMSNALKTVMPSDVRLNPERYQGKLIHWIGIVKSYDVLDSVNNDIMFRLDQKFYDYIEDFSIQRETIFLSPKGEGEFYYIQSFPDSSSDTIKKWLDGMVYRNDLAFCYGDFYKLENDLPVLVGKRTRFIHEQFYSTQIMSYGIKRDNEGKIIADVRGYPECDSLKLLQIPRSGEND